MESATAALGVYCGTWLVVIAGIAFGSMIIPPSWGPHSPPHVTATGDAVVDTLTLWDGQWYLEIAQNGYRYNPRRMSSVAFFPAYPMLIRAVSTATRLRPQWAALLIANAFLLAAYWLLFVYVRRRFRVGGPPGHNVLVVGGLKDVSPPEGGTPTGGTPPVERLPVYVLLALGLFPTTFFMRMAYPESMFLFLTVAAMYGIERKWPWWLVAAIAGLATATRFVGIALLAPLVGYAWGGERGAGSGEQGVGSREQGAGSGEQGEGKRGTGRLQSIVFGTPTTATTMSTWCPTWCPTWCATWCPVPATLGRVGAAIAIALSGLLAYMAYQGFAFGEPLAFAKAQDFWQHRGPEDVVDKILSLASFDPLWLAYIRGSAGYAGLTRDPAPALFSLQFANPVLFVGAVALVIVGAWKGWLSWPEILLSAGLILVPYAGKGFEMCMASQGRFVAAAFPIYIVLGNLLIRLPRPWAVAILAVFGTYLAIYSAMLAAGYVLI
jgi:hypothetical protein